VRVVDQYHDDHDSTPDNDDQHATVDHDHHSAADHDDLVFLDDAASYDDDIDFHVHHH